MEGAVTSSQPQARRVSFRISFHRLCTLLSWNLEQAIKMIVSVSGGSYSCISVFSVYWRLLHSCHSIVFVWLQFKRFLVDSPLQVNMFSLGHFTRVLWDVVTPSTLLHVFVFHPVKLFGSRLLATSLLLLSVAKCNFDTSSPYVKCLLVSPFIWNLLRSTKIVRIHPHLECSWTSIKKSKP